MAESTEKLRGTLKVSTAVMDRIYRVIEEERIRTKRKPTHSDLINRALASFESMRVEEISSKEASETTSQADEVGSTEHVTLIVLKSTMVDLARAIGVPLGEADSDEAKDARAVVKVISKAKGALRNKGRDKSGNQKGTPPGRKTAS